MSVIFGPFDGLKRDFDPGEFPRTSNNKRIIIKATIRKMEPQKYGESKRNINRLKFTAIANQVEQLQLQNIQIVRFLPKFAK